MEGGGSMPEPVRSRKSVPWLWIVALLLSMPLRTASAKLFSRFCPQGNRLHTAIVLTGRTLLSLAILVLSVALLVGATNNAFIYTRF